MTGIRIERQGAGFLVRVTDPEIEKQNRANSSAPWKDPCSEYNFEKWDQVKTFMDKVLDRALPPDEFARAFEDAAKEAKNGSK